MLLKSSLAIYAIVVFVWTLPAQGFCLMMSAGATGKIATMPSPVPGKNVRDFYFECRDSIKLGLIPPAAIDKHYATNSPAYESYREWHQQCRSPSEPQLELHHDPEEVIKHTKAWVDGMMVGLRLCPFTASLPPERIRYEVSTATTIVGMHADWCDSVGRFTDTDEEEVASLMLVFPQFTSDFPRFFVFCNLQHLQFEKVALLQEMHFHPDKDFPIDETPGAVDRYATRSPFPMSHIVRRSTISKAWKGDDRQAFLHQKEDNRRKLAELGEDKLQAMLDARDWSELKKGN